MAAEIALLAKRLRQRYLDRPDHNHDRYFRSTYAHARTPACLLFLKAVLGFFRRYSSSRRRPEPTQPPICRQPLDWEVVESHAVAPVQVLFKDDGSYPPESGGLALTPGMDRRSEKPPDCA